jgi:hypothetical protein
MEREKKTDHWDESKGKRIKENKPKRIERGKGKRVGEKSWPSIPSF